MPGDGRRLRRPHCAGFTTSAWPPAARMGCSVPASPGGTSRAPRVSFSPSARPCVAEHARLFVAAYWSEESMTTPSAEEDAAQRQKSKGLPEGDLAPAEQRRQQPIPKVQHYFAANGNKYR